MVEIILDYPDGVSTVKNTLIRGRQGPQSQRRNYKDGSRGWSDAIAERDTLSQEYRQPTEAGKGEGHNLP